MIIKGEEYAKIYIDEICPKSPQDEINLRNEVCNNLTEIFYMDECGQVWTMRSQGLIYLAKCKL